mmetsp:Transcript_53898/g.89480  ORF Transcript_53898/g.89480 Transcript_53898/m.89480 type:complete len:129 (+) Transcript_53898:101-487(+)
MSNPTRRGLGWLDTSNRRNKQHVVAFEIHVVPAKRRASKTLPCFVVFRFLCMMQSTSDHMSMQTLKLEECNSNLRWHNYLERFRSKQSIADNSKSLQPPRRALALSSLHNRAAATSSWHRVVRVSSSK